MNYRFNKLNHCLQGQSAVLSGINLLTFTVVYSLSLPSWQLKL